MRSLGILFSNYSSPGRAIEELISWPHRVLGPKILKDEELVEMLYITYSSNKVNLKEYIEQSETIISRWKYDLNILYSKQARLTKLESAEKLYKAFLVKCDKFYKDLEKINANVKINCARLEELITKIPELRAYDNVGMLIEDRMNKIHISRPTFQQWQTAELLKLKRGIKVVNTYLSEEKKAQSRNVQQLKKLKSKL